MKQYRVLLAQTVIEHAYVNVLAETEEDAQEQAVDIALNGVDVVVSWEFVESIDGIEAINTTLIPGKVL